MTTKTAAPPRWSPPSLAVAAIIISSLAGYLLAAQERVLLVAGYAPILFAALASPVTVIVAGIPLAALNPRFLGGVPVASAMIIGLAASWLLGLLTGRWRLHGVHLLVVQLAGWLLFAHLRSGQGQNGFRGFILGLLLLSVAVSVHLPLRSLLTASSAYGVVAAVVTLAGWRSGTRAAGVGLNPNYLGLVLAVGLVALLGETLRTRRPVWVLGFALTASALVKTGSRSALVSAAFGAAILLLSGRPLRVQAVALIAIPGLAFLVPTESVQSTLLPNRGALEQSYNSSLRMQAAVSALHAAIEHPLTGIGYANFPEYAAADQRLGIYMNTHNDYLRLAAETGVPGVGLLLTLLLLPIGRRGRPLTQNERAATALIATYSVGLLFANTLESLQVTVPVWVLLGSLWHIRTCAPTTCAGANAAVAHSPTVPAIPRRSDLPRARRHG